MPDCLLAGTWNEHRVLNERTLKAWQEYEERQPTVEPNWDRNAKREPKPQMKKPVTKPSKPRATKAAPAKTANVKEPAVVFVTPPITPPPPPAETIKVDKNFKKDDDFWNFYNEGR